MPRLRLPAVAEQCAPLAEVAVKQRQTYLRYLEALLAAELEERERNTIARRIKDARLPRMKTLDEFDFSKAPQIPATKIHELAQGGYIERAEPVILIGDCGTGKTHLLTGLCVAACRQKRRVRFATAAALVNELVEAKQQLQLRRVLARWERYDLIAIDEVGYVPMADLGAEFLFQVIAERAEKAAVILTTNLPFSEWTQVIPNARLLQGAAGSHHRSGPHHRNRHRQLSLPPDGGGRKEEEGFVITGPGKGLNRRPFPGTPSRL